MRSACLLGLFAAAAVGLGAAAAQTTAQTSAQTGVQTGGQATPEAGGDLNALPTHPDAVAAKPAQTRRRARRARPVAATPPPPDFAADRAALRHAEAIAHGETSRTQAPTTNSGYTGGPEPRGDILKSGPTGPQ